MISSKLYSLLSRQCTRPTGVLAQTFETVTRKQQSPLLLQKRQLHYVQHKMNQITRNQFSLSPDEKRTILRTLSSVQSTQMTPTPSHTQGPSTQAHRPNQSLHTEPAAAASHVESVDTEDVEYPGPRRPNPSYESTRRESAFYSEEAVRERQESPLTSRRVDPATVHQVYYFDTLALTKKLEAKGFSRDQAEGCAECLVEIINTTLDHQGRHMITKPQQEIAVQQLYSEIVSVKKDMTLLQKSEFSTLKTETQRLHSELNQIQDHLNDEIAKLQGHFSLDLNLEKGRAIEAHAENEKQLQILHNKIDTEVANLKTVYEQYRNDILKYAGGSLIAMGSLALGILRLWH